MQARVFPTMEQPSRSDSSLWFVLAVCAALTGYLLGRFGDFGDHLALRRGCVVGIGLAVKGLLALRTWRMPGSWMLHMGLGAAILSSFTLAVWIGIALDQAPHSVQEFIGNVGAAARHMI